MFGPKAMKGFFGGWHRPGFGHGPRRGRMFDKGDLKYVILDLLKDEPSHGYEVIRKLEERSRGFYSPSPGSVYPTLQLLEDMEYVSATQRDGKKVYAITDQGRKFLDENQRSVEDIWGKFGGSWDPGVASELAPDILDGARRSRDDKRVKEHFSTLRPSGFACQPGGCAAFSASQIGLLGTRELK